MLPRADERIKVVDELLNRQRRLQEDLETAHARYLEQIASDTVSMDALRRAEAWHAYLAAAEDIAAGLRELRNWAITDAVENAGASPTGIARRLKMTRTAVLKICASTMEKFM